MWVQFPSEGLENPRDSALTALTQVRLVLINQQAKSCGLGFAMVEQLPSLITSIICNSIYFILFIEIIMIFKTVYSMYELDKTNRIIRRLSGINNPVSRQGEDGQWKKYNEIGELVIGLPLIIVWEIGMDDSGEVVLRTTQTSIVSEIANQTSN